MNAGTQDELKPETAPKIKLDGISEIMKPVSESRKVKEQMYQQF